MNINQRVNMLIQAFQITMLVTVVCLVARLVWLYVEHGYTTQVGQDVLMLVPFVLGAGLALKVPTN